MPSTHLNRRIALIHLVLEIRRAINKTAETQALSMGETMVFLAILLGELEGRLMSVSDISATTGHKFATCHRYIQALKARDLVASQQVGKRVVLCMKDDLDDPSVSRLFKELYATMRRGIRNLHKIESEPTGSFSQKE